MLAKFGEYLVDAEFYIQRRLLKLLNFINTYHTKNHIIFWSDLASYVPLGMPGGLWISGYRTLILYREKVTPQMCVKLGQSENFGHYCVEKFMTPLIADGKSKMGNNCRRAYLEKFGK